MKLLHFYKNKNSKNNSINQRPFFKRMGRDVHVDWFLSITFAFICMIVLVFMGLFLQSSFNHSLNSETKNIIVKDSSDSDNMVLDKILEKYEKKNLKRESLIQQYVGPNDPSI